MKWGKKFVPYETNNYTLQMCKISTIFQLILYMNNFIILDKKHKEHLGTLIYISSILLLLINSVLPLL